MVERIALFRSEVEARGRAFDPMSVAVSRSVHVSMTAGERDKALEARVPARQRMERLAQRPDGQNRASIASYAHTLDLPHVRRLLQSQAGVPSIRRRHLP